MKARVTVTLKTSILDPQGQAVMGTAKRLGFASVHAVRVGKMIEVDVGETSAEAARPLVEKLAQELLANPVTEEYKIEFEGA